MGMGKVACALEHCPACGALLVAGKCIRCGEEGH